MVKIIIPFILQSAYKLLFYRSYAHFLTIRRTGSWQYHTKKKQKKTVKTLQSSVWWNINSGKEEVNT